MSVGFRPVEVRRRPHGESAVVRGQVKEVSLISIGAYEGANVLQLRDQHAVDQQTLAERMQWHVPSRLAHLIKVDEHGYPREVPVTPRQAPFVPRGFNRRV